MQRWLPLLLVPVLACSSANRDWRKAKRAGTAEAYRPIANNLSHKKRAKAYKRVEALDWKHGEEVDSSKAWKAYLSHHPSSPRAAEARARRDEARWQEVVQADSRTTYDAWLSMNGGSPHAAEARQRIQDLGWKEATLANTPDAYAKYIVRNPSGEYTEQARAARRALFWEQATTSDRPADYVAFVDQFPDSPQAAEARVILEGFEFTGVAVRIVARKLVRDDSVQSYEKQLMASLGEVLKASNFEVAWLEPVDAVKPGAINPLAGLMTTVPEDHAALVVEVRESRGAAFAPSGYATDIVATVHLVPPGRMEAMDVREVKATTGDDVRAPGDRALHLDAQRALGDAILAAGFEFEKWRR